MGIEAANGFVHRRFLERAREEPARVAVRSGGRSTSYGELAERASRLARFLQDQGVGPEVPVGLHVPRTLDQAVGLLGILASGGAYVPLDPEQPAERLAGILADTRAPVVLSHAGLHAPGASARVVPIDDPAIARHPPDPRPVPWDPARLAYVIYTSGSTGRPKGVQVEHGALSARYPISPYATLLGPGDVLAAITAVSWAPSIFEVLYTLARGGTVAIADRDVVRDPARLARFLDDEAVTFARAVPSLWQALLDAGWKGRSELAVVCHGERLPAPLAARLRACGRGVWNTYGSTEATAWCTTEVGDDPSRIAPVDGASGGVRVLRADLAPVVAGEEGEICVVGPVVARGYLGDPEATAARFVDDPARGRIYRTGDRGRVLPDGRIEILGRRDRQVKIRGHRVELGEVEAALGRCAGVREAAVVVRDDPHGGRLAAYVAGEASAAGLRAELARHLPEPMIPASFTRLDALPRNANGKVDLGALPAPAPESRGAEPPATDVQRALAAVFGELLGVDGVGLDDSFFELGGHSLLAARVAARVRQDLDLDLSLQAFFEAPTVRALAEALERRRALGERSTLPPIAPGAPDRMAPLSYAQERLWFLDRLTPDEVAYSLPVAYRLRGDLDIPALEEAIRGVLDRHGALRTSFAVDAEGVPRQTVHAMRFDLARIDLSDRPDAEAAATEVVAREARRPFDLSRAPLFRAALVRLAPAVHVLFVNVHHIASDGWSQALLRRELSEGYRASLAGGPPPPAPPIRYVDFARWQRTHRTASELARQSAWWRERLAGLEPLSLPADRPRPRVFTSRGAREEAVIPAAVVEAAKALGLRHGASLYMVLLAAFQVVLARTTGQRDVAVGSPIAGRGVAETEGLIGFFVNTLVMRAEVHGPFDALLGRVRATALEAYAHADLPFERLVSDLNPTRDPGRHPLVDVVLALQNTPFGDLDLPGVRADPFPIGAAASRFDLEVHAWDRAEGLVCHAIYNPDLFDAWRVRQVLGHLEAVLREVAREPGQDVARIPLLSPAERHTILRAWNDTRVDFGPERPVHRRFADRAREAPHALAVARGDEALTYGEVARRADALARTLRDRGVGRGSIVGVGLESSPDLVVAIVAILAAGAAWLPLDPAYPPERLAFMLADSGAALLVTRRGLADRFERVPLVRIDEDHGGSPAPLPEVEPGDLAYVIYTSGSTGRPHGVQIEHRGLSNLASAYARTHAIAPSDRACLVASPSFDASVVEIWPALVSGASLHVPDPEVRAFPTRLLAWMAERGVTLGYLPTPILEACLEEGFPPMPALRTVLTGGDRLRRRPPPEATFTVFNAYGPTENTVVSTAWPVLPDEPGLPPIGRPIANTTAYVLDALREPVPIGSPGELYVGGVGLARGYVGRPDLTAERFVPNPFGEGRLYRTGDRARARPDGVIEFLGRLDHQVKIRGVRVEPAEVDAVLATCPGVAESVTIARDDGPGGARLVSYVVADRRDDALAREQVDRWQALYDAEYATAPADVDPEFDITGWNSSFTGRPIPAHEMREWVEGTLRWVLAHGPRDVLEIGCGTGLLAFPLARVARRYAGTDLSARAVAAIRRRLDAAGGSADVSLEARPAHDLGWLADRRFDTVVLNSVVQYFPSAAYLEQVLAEAIDRVVVGGRVLVGDVRNLDLLEAFHAAVEAARGEPGASAEEVARRIEARVLDDKELVLAPAFFTGLPERLPRVAAVAVRPKPGRSRNEMTRFRCDVTLYLDVPPRRVEAREVRWGVDVDGLDALAERLGEPLLVRGLADSRSFAGGVDLDALVELATPHGQRVDLRLAPGSRWVDALFVPAGSGEVTTEALEAKSRRPGALASDPLRRARAARRLPAIRERLAAALPDVMIPSAFVFLDAIPLTPNGKVDRARLPAPRSARSELLGDYVAPRDATEEALARLVAQALGLDEVGVHDNFFAIGGHSLLAVQVVTRVHEVLGVDLPLAALFEGPTVAAMAARVGATGRGEGQAPEPDDDLERLPLTPMDAQFHYGRLLFETEPTAWYQLLEIVAPRLRLDRLEEALRYAVNRHPIARGHLNAPAAMGERVWWEVGRRVGEAPLTVHEAADDAEADALAERIVDTPYPLDEAPSVRFALVRAGARDRLFVRFNHGAIDGAGLHCLVSSILSRYLGRDDPSLRFRPFSAREILDAWGRVGALDRGLLEALADNAEIAHLVDLLGGRGTRLQRPRTRLSRPSEVFPAPIHGLGGVAGDRRCEKVEVPFTAGEWQRLADAVRARRTTLDRLFAVGLLEGAAAWNRAVAGDPRRVEAYWAVNLRPPRYFTSVVANQFAWSRVRAPWPDEVDALLDPSSDFLVRGALDWLEVAERFHRLPVPDALRRHLLAAVRRSAPALVISNVLPFGELEQGPLARAVGVERFVHHARFGFTDRPVIVVARRDDRFHVRMIYPRAQFDPRGATRFLEACRQGALALAERLCSAP